MAKESNTQDLMESDDLEKNFLSVLNAQIGNGHTEGVGNRIFKFSKGEREKKTNEVNRLERERVCEKTLLRHFLQISCESFCATMEESLPHREFSFPMESPDGCKLAAKYYNNEF